MKMISIALNAILAISSFVYINFAYATTTELLDCNQLAAPKTVLLVHATWCPHCQGFLPTYKDVSDLPEMQGYTFYTKENNSVDAVCGIPIYGVPITFTRNMQEKIVGAISQSQLIEFVQSEN